MTTIATCEPNGQTKYNLVPSISPKVNLAECEENQEDTSQAR